MIALLVLLTAAEPYPEMIAWFGKIANQQLNQREAAIRQVHTRQQAEARKARTRELLLQSLNGLPDYHGPLNAQVRGTVDAGKFRIEKLTYESLPHYLVTANLYVPKGAGKHPAVLFPLGHWEQGKPYAQRIAGNLAQKGFVVLAYDPVGQGERVQAFDARVGRSLAGGSTDEHMMAGALALLIGDGLMRYFVNDGMRGIDYLLTRPEVDGERIGVTGCSGGGTVTTFLSALDPRVKAAAPACYMQTFRYLVSGPVGDSEQSNPNFVALGLDQADMVELFAPKPWLMSSTEQDFFKPEFAKPVYDEARKFYDMYGAEDRIRWIVGPGGHGTPLPVREGIYGWMLRWLGGASSTEGKSGGTANAQEEDVPLFAEHELWVTESGQLAPTDSRELYEILAERMKARQSPADLRAYLKQGVQETEPDPAFKIDLLPAMGTPTGRGVLIVAREREMDLRAAELSAAGDVVMVVHPRGLPTADNYSGDPLPAIRATLIGRNLPFLRARDVLTAAQRLASTPGVRQIHAEARGVAGYWLLVAAALDERIATIRLISTPVSIRQAFSTPLSRGVYLVAMPDFALHWDTPDLVKLVQPRKVTWVDPMDWYQTILRMKGEMYEYSKYEH